jgi:hypothetical protein
LLIRKAEMELVKNWKNFQGWDNRNCWWIRWGVWEKDLLSVSLRPGSNVCAAPGKASFSDRSPTFLRLEGDNLKQRNRVATSLFSWVSIYPCEIHLF